MNAKRKDRRPRVRPEARPRPEAERPGADELDLREGARARRWQKPPRALADRVRRWPSERIAPDRSRSSEHVEWRPGDVRSGAELREAGQPILLSRILDDGELTLTATPPQGEGAWGFNGRVWLEDETPLRVLLVHDDHVVHQVEVRSGEYFEFEEFVPGGWSIEVHLSRDRTLVLDDPTA